VPPALKPPADTLCHRLEVVAVDIETEVLVDLLASAPRHRFLDELEVNPKNGLPARPLAARQATGGDVIAWSWRSAR